MTRVWTYLGASVLRVLAYAPGYAPNIAWMWGHFSERRWAKYKLKSPHGAGFMDVAGLNWIVDWWRRRELNPRPQVLRHKVYMLIPRFDLASDYPSGQENHQRFRKVLAHPYRTDFSAILCR